MMMAASNGGSTRWQRLKRLEVMANDGGDGGSAEFEDASTGAPTPSSPPPPPPSSTPGSTSVSAALPDLLGSRSLGLDWGHKKIGVGLSAGFSQRPLGTIPNAGGISGNATKSRPTFDHILALMRAEGAVRIVMGNPLFRCVVECILRTIASIARRCPDTPLPITKRNSDGTLSPQANSTKTFARQLVNRAVELGMAQPWSDEAAGAAPPFLYLWDERLTSQAARVNIKTKAFLHSCAFETQNGFGSWGHLEL